LILSGNAASTLIDRGAGMIYDSEQDLTWLVDANYALISNESTYAVDANGRMSWGTAWSWADELVYNGYDDWRLPQLKGDNRCDYFSQEKIVAITSITIPVNWPLCSMPSLAMGANTSRMAAETIQAALMNSPTVCKTPRQMVSQSPTYSRT
jgi:hypothetical protein